MNSTQRTIITISTVLFVVLPLLLHSEPVRWDIVKPQERCVFDIQFVSRSTGWAVGTFGTILHTSDSGKTWNIQQSAYGGHLKSISFIDERTGWIAGDGTILHTTDGGEKWIDQTPEYSHQYNRIRFFTSLQGYVSGYNDEITRTSDGGITWHTAKSKNVDINNHQEISFLSSELGWKIDSAKVFRTLDGGKSWLPCNVNAGSRTHGIHFFDTKHGIVLDTWDTIFVTKDGGDNWSTIRTGPDVTINRCGFFDSQNGWGYGLFRSREKKAHVAILYHTTDGGYSWIRPTIIGDYSLQCLTFIDKDYGWAGGWGGTILRTTDGGDHWSEPYEFSFDKQSTPIETDSLSNWKVDTMKIDYDSFFTEKREKTKVPVGDGKVMELSAYCAISVDFVDTSNGWMLLGEANRSYRGSEQSVMIHTSDGGRTWHKQYEQPRSHLHKIKFLNRTHGWAIGRQQILITTDGGISWKERSGNKDEVFLVDACFLDSNIGWILSGNDRTSQLFKTTTGGTNWRKVNSVLPNRLSKLSMLDWNNGWASNDSGIYRTCDGGVTWQKMLTVSGFILKDYRFLDLLHGWAFVNYQVSSSNTQILHTSDGGEHWEHLNCGRFSWVTNFFFFDENNGWMTGDDGPIFYTENGGRNWIRQQADLRGNILFIKKFDDNSGIGVNHDGRILRYTPHKFRYSKPSISLEEFY